MYADISCSEKSVPEVRLQRAEGSTRLVLHRKAGQTRLNRLFQSGCAKIRLPAKLFAEAPQEAILINTAGGLTGGDHIKTEVVAEFGTDAIVTTQACERIYRSTGDMARVQTRLTVKPKAFLAWLPQETILFNGGKLQREIEVELYEDAELLAVEAVLFGRKAMSETVQAGMFRDSWRVRSNGRLIHADDIKLDSAIADQLNRPCFFGGHMAAATLLMVSNEIENLVDEVRYALGEYGGASAFEGKLVARVTAPDSLALRRAIEPALTVLMRGRTLPKVWQL